MHLATVAGSQAWNIPAPHVGNGPERDPQIFSTCLGVDEKLDLMSRHDLWSCRHSEAV
jgi:hypothetical protein